MVNEKTLCQLPVRKMSSKYTIKHKKNPHYIHFRPPGEYYIGETLLGAATFSESGGNSLIREAGLGPE